jgi:hypothetical protein
MPSTVTKCILINNIRGWITLKSHFIFYG